MYSTSFDTCYGTRNSCPSTSITTCNHNEDITVTCSKLLFFKNNFIENNATN